MRIGTENALVKTWKAVQINKDGEQAEGSTLITKMEGSMAEADFKMVEEEVDSKGEAGEGEDEDMDGVDIKMKSDWDSLNKELTKQLL